MKAQKMPAEPEPHTLLYRQQQTAAVSAGAHMLAVAAAHFGQRHNSDCCAMLLLPFNQDLNVTSLPSKPHRHSISSSFAVAPPSQLTGPAVAV